MKKTYFSIILLIQSILFAGGFENLGVHSRPVGLGGAFYGVGDAAYTVFYNPAGLSNLTRFEINSTYSNLFPGIEDDNIHYLTLSATYPNELLGSVGVGVTFLKTGMWQENTLIFSYSHIIYDKFALGGSAKILRWSSQAAPGESSLSYFGYTFDVGAFYIFDNIFSQNDIRLGVAAQDITQPSISKNGSKDAQLPMKLALGFSIYSSMYNYLFAADIVKENDIYQVKVGAEFLALKTKLFNNETGFTLRGGYNSIVNDTYEKQSAFNGGFGIYYNNFKIDYAYVYNFIMQSLGGSHKISLGYQF